MSLPTKENVTRPEAFGYHALIEYGDEDAESLYLPLAVGPGRQMRLSTFQVADEGPRTAENPEDMRSESGQTFSRAAFTGGEGLARAHRVDGTDRDRTRFWDSKNIDVTPSRGSQPEEISLLHATAEMTAADASNTRMPLVRLGAVLYAVASNDTQVDRSANPTAASPTVTQESPGGTGDVLDLAGLGDQLYAATSNIRLRSSAGSWSSWSDLAPSRLWSAKGRILAAVGDDLYEARASTGSVLLHTLPSGQTWGDVVDAGAAILAGGSDGYVYAFVEENGELILAGRTLIEGESITALGFAQGLVFVGTGQATTGGGTIGRLYRAVLVGLRLREAQVVRTWGTGSATLDHSPKRIIATREAVWTGIREASSESNLWRYHLETGGIVRDLVFAASGVIQGIAVFDDRMFATVHVDGLYRELTTYADSGYLIGPVADFFNAARKTWVGARLTTGTIPAEASVVLAYSTDPEAIEDPADGTWVNIITANSGAPGNSAESPITEVESRYLATKVTLTPNDANTATPSVLAYAVRALPLPTEEEWSIPVNVSDRLEMPNRAPLTVNGIGDARYDQLLTLKGRAVTFTLLRPDEVVVGQITGVATPIEQLPKKGSPTVYALMNVRGQRQ